MRVTPRKGFCAAVSALAMATSGGWESAWISVFPGVGADTAWRSEIAEAGAGSGCSYQFRVSRSEDGVGVEAEVRDDEVTADDRFEVAFPAGVTCALAADGTGCGADWSGSARPLRCADGRRSGTAYRLRVGWRALGVAAPRPEDDFPLKLSVLVRDADATNVQTLAWSGAYDSKLVKGLAYGTIVLPGTRRETFSGSEVWGGRRRHPAVVNAVGAEPSDDVLSLNGTWAFRTDLAHLGPCYARWNYPDNGTWTNSIVVPGAWEAQGYGKPGLGEPHLSIDQAPKPLRHAHVGKGCYRRTVTLPAGWKGKRVWLKVGGVRSQGWFYVNGTGVALVDAYAGAWKYEVTDLVRPGDPVHLLAVVDNKFGCRNAQPGNVTRWGGLVRGIELEATPDCFIDDAWVRGDFDRQEAEVHVELAGEVKSKGEGEQRTDLFSLRVTIEDETKEITLHRSPSPSDFTLKIPLRNFRPWSPERPNLYWAKIELLKDGEVVQVRKERFGVRKLEVRGRDFYLNGEPYYLRGFGDDSTYPLTGVTPPDRAYHLRHLRRAKAAGFNYVRLHTHAETPEYFEACDELGIMVQAELSYYFDNAMDHFSYDPVRDADDRWVALRRHPSWCVSSSGNEGQLGPVASSILYDRLKRTDPDRLVQDQDGPSHPAADFRKTEDFCGGPLNAWPRGAFNPPMPFVCHEYMNLCVKQDSRLEPKFTGVWLPPATRKDRAETLAKAGLTHVWGDRFHDAQHALQKCFQKLGVEAARRDPYCRGYCYWTIADVGVLNEKLGFYTAQGLFDCFWGTKRGGATPQDFARFNSADVVLLDLENAPLPLSGDFRSGWNSRGHFPDTNRCFRVGETIPATFLYANYRAPVPDAALAWRLSADGRVLTKGRRPLGDLPVGPVRTVGEEGVVVPPVPRPTRARLVAEVVETGGAVRQSNDWDFWLFPKRTSKSAPSVWFAPAFARAAARYRDLAPTAADARVVVTTEGSDEARAALASGRSVLTLTGCDGPANFRLGWWWIGKQVGTAVVRHPAFGDFPHEPFLSPLLFRLVKEGTPLPLAGIGEDDLIIAGEGAEGFYLYLAEEKIPGGARKLRVSGLDLLSDTPEGASLLDNLLDYLKEFGGHAPREELRRYN